MLSKECRLARREIDELELGERLTESASAHLSACVTCREFRAERIELRELVGSLEPVAAPADFEMRLRARIARDSATVPEPFFARFLRTPALAAAALFVVVGGATVWIAQRNDQQPAGPLATRHAPSQPGSDVASSANDGNPTIDTVVPDENPNAGSDQVVASVPARRRSPRAPRSVDYDVQPASSVRNDQAFVNAPSQPVVFAVEDERGTKRKISLPPVSFGSQSLVDNRVPVSYTGNSRIW